MRSQDILGNFGNVWASPTARRRMCFGHKKINFSTVFAGQAIGIKEVHDDIWLVSLTEYDLGYFDLETRVLEPLQNPFGPKVLPTYVSGTFCYTHVSGPLTGFMEPAMGIERNAQSIPWNFNVLRGVAAAGFYTFECFGNIKGPIAAFWRLEKSGSPDYVTDMEVGYGLQNHGP